LHFKGVDMNQKVGEQAFEVDQKVSVWGKLMGRPKTRGGGGAIVQNCQTKLKVSWLLSKFIPKKRVDFVWFYTTLNNTSVIS
jgi:hypothetical protein